MSLNNLKNIVIHLLKEVPATRNSDRILYDAVCNSLGIDTKKVSVWELMHDKNAPSTESVRRARQKAQAEFPELKAVIEVQRYRERQERIYLDFARGRA